MKSLYLRIWLTVVTALALFALASGWLVQRHLEQERQRAEAVITERMAAWGDLIQNSIPGPGATAEEQTNALREWSRRLRVPLALHDVRGHRIGASESYLRREADGPNGPRRPFSIHLEDGRTLWLMRPNMVRLQRGEQALEGERPPPLAIGAVVAPGGSASGVIVHNVGGEDRPDLVPGGPPGAPPDPMVVVGQGAVPGGPGGGGGFRIGLPLPPPPADWLASLGLVALLLMLFLAVAGGAYPVVRRLTRRLETLKQGVETFGAGALHHRVLADGKDEVAALATSFNRAASRIEALVKSNQSLLANASHELRSPLARLKMAVAMLDDAPPSMQAGLRREIDTNIGELDSLVEEVLLSSRLDAGAVHDLAGQVDLAGLLAEEASRVGAELTASPEGAALRVPGSERLLRRAARNLLENARRYGGGEVSVELGGVAGGQVAVRVCDRGVGVPEAERERIFEPFYRLPGHAEREGGVGLGLALVRQIAAAHRGEVRCEARDGGGSCFVITLPVAAG
ncbi:MAG TPA: ATP-binding protein [Ideonella sp.]|uniref:sensor histidine kinase n=1 Tax=Ideonella sp. TaxID=1929293 RepID=UPI002E352B54|nr:ATP-binding protein [Ideonella sp.]HEX5683753.1 ATP-binding protein [Ideonella sp.]